ncbi:MAG: ATP-dependent RecD-like DNA helicase [Desulfovibrio sp.]|jgi:exodeoxyribonuclease V alpha subunit|nr:ATP-dependent RecD-like DNA helicase [Desulfovibrio sp.]
MPSKPSITDTNGQKPFLVEIRGQLERVTFSNEETGYTIAKLKVYGRRDLVTIVGNIMNPTPGEVMKVKGEWANHSKFGEQFKVVYYQCTVPATTKGIEKYLGSGLIKGIGPVMAKRIVAAFGDKTLTVIEERSDRLMEVPGIGQSRVGMIAKAWQEQREIREVMVFLQSHGVSSTYAAKIFKQYGNDSIKIVRENPYRLAYDIFGIGFLTADRIAEKIGFDKQSTERTQAGLIYALYEFSDEGHVFVSREYLLSKAREILDVEFGILENVLPSLVESQQIVIETLSELNEQQKTTDAVYLAKFHFSEVHVAARLKTLLKVPKSVRNIDVPRAIEWVQGKLSITLAEKQVEAVQSSVTNKVAVITGGPGTGKTTIIRAILRIFAPLTKRILLAAPTGRAAKRMSETTGYEAKTIHRLLEYSMTNGGFQKNEDHPLDADLVIIDETSMLDLILMHHLLKAVPDSAVLIFVGDVDQLPSVGAGSVLKDIIASKVVSVVTLNEIFRQARTSSIVVNAHKIIKGEMPSLTPTENDDFFFFKSDDPDDALPRVLDVVKMRIPQRFGYRPLEDIQVLTPMNRGSVGTSRLNEALQDTLNPNGFELVRGGRKYRIGDKVMQIRNNYDKEVYNGDIGIIAGIDTEAQTVSVNVDGRDVEYGYTETDELVPAYAISIHKSQGSEYPVVVIPIMTQHYAMLQRNLLYTGVTRGKKLVVLVGTQKAIAIAVKNNKISKRNSWLFARLAEK